MQLNKSQNKTIKYTVKIEKIFHSSWEQILGKTDSVEKKPE